jgi:hypothetical protein
MARPKTEAAAYKLVTFRMPPDLLERVRRLTQDSGAPLNTELVKLVRFAVETKEKASTPEGHHVTVGSRDN